MKLGSAPLQNPMLIASIVACAFFMEMLDSTIIVTALPRMAIAFHATPIDLSLGITVYLLTLAILIPASGWISDRFGARTVFCAAIAVFTLASMLCGFSENVGQFVGARILQGLGGALMSPVGRLVLLRATEKKDLVRVMNFVTLPGLIGPIIGPPVGGFITTYLSWRYIFFLNLPIGILGMAMVLLLIRNFRDETKKPFDYVGFLLNGGALCCVIYGMDLLGTHGSTWLGGVLVMLGLAIGFGAIRHAKRTEHPLVDLTALRIHTFAVINTGGAFFRIAIAAPTFLLPLLFQVGLGMTAFMSGLLILVHAIGDIGAKIGTTRGLRYFGFRTMLIWSTIIFALSIAACAAFTASTPVVAILVILFIGGVCRSLQMTSQTALQFADIGPAEITGASTLSSVLLQVIRAIGVGFAAVLLNVSLAFRGGQTLSMIDFRIALLVIAAVALLSLLWYLPLEHGAGAELTGHDKKTGPVKQPSEAGADD